MSRYIDADVARRIIDSPRSKEQMLLVLSQAEPADVVEVVHGEWVLNDDQVYECKDCGYVPSFDGYTYFNYCPNCGAKMDL